MLLAPVSSVSFVSPTHRPFDGRPLDQVVSVFRLVDPCRKLITTYKDRKEVRLATVLADLLCAYIDPAWIAPEAKLQPSSSSRHGSSLGNPLLRDRSDPSACPLRTALVVIPARKQALRERGFDHMKRVGDELSRLSGLPLLDLIQVNERSDQRGLSASSRQRNMRQSFLPRWPTRVTHSELFASTRVPNSRTCNETPVSARASSPPNRSTLSHERPHDLPTNDAQPPGGSRPYDLPTNVILVDDVLTTGATLTAAATTLKEMGVRRVFGLTVARLP